jgi:hypothetical protein
MTPIDVFMMAGAGALGWGIGNVVIDSTVRSINVFLYNRRMKKLRIEAPEEEETTKAVIETLGGYQ